MEAAIRFSQNSPPGNHNQQFLHIDVTGKAFSLCEITGIYDRKVKYDVVCTSVKVPAFRAFDWHPTNASLVAVGQSGGEATLLNIAEGYHDQISFSVRNQRLCNAVALNSDNLIAVGLDKVRTDFCLNIWDLTQRLPSGGSRSFSKGHAEPVHKLAGGEPISSLKFINAEPQLLIAGVKSQFVRLYDLREPNSSNGLQFATRCVHNLATDSLDDNYFASCYPSKDPLVCIWDKRMASRAGASPVSFTGAAQPDNKHPNASLELEHAVDDPGVIWSLRFSKSRRGCLGVLSSVGQLKAYSFEKEFTESTSREPGGKSPVQSGQDTEPEQVFLDRIHEIEQSCSPTASPMDQKERIVSFDFTTSSTSLGESKLVVLTGGGEVLIRELTPPPEPAGLSSTGFFCRGSTFTQAPAIDLTKDSVTKSVDRIRRVAEPRNTLRKIFKQSKQHKSSGVVQSNDLRRMSSFSNQCWDRDLGFNEKGVSLDDLLMLLSASRIRCETGYLLNASKNRNAVAESQWLESYWSWIERAERVSKSGNMTQDNIDLSFLGVYGIWMEEISIKPRLIGSNSIPMSSVIKNLAHRLNIPIRRLCPTGYRAHRQLCLHISGLAWSHDELENMVKKLISGNQHTKAAAMALFASDDKLAYHALRSKTSTQTHKMLAMALAGSKQRRKSTTSSTATDDSSANGDDDDEWTETISSLATDLTDAYARAILAYVKSGDWLDVLDVEALPLKHRVNVALRHLDDNELTAYIGRITRQVIETGDVEGIILTGTGTTEGLGLLSSYTRAFNDLQTAILGLSVGGAAERFIVNKNERDTKANRTVEAFRETYRSQIMRWGLRYDRVRFDVATSRTLAQSAQHKLPRPKEQVRLVCTFCSGSLTQFPSNGAGGSEVSTSSLSQGPGSLRISEKHSTEKHPLTAEKAAVSGTVCPKCGRHLPRCGVCDLWLGTPDDTYSKWFISQQQQQQQQQQKNAKSTPLANGANVGKGKRASVDVPASMSGSIVTTIGPPVSTSASTTLKAESDADRDGDSEDDANESDDDGLAAARAAAEQEQRWLTAMQKFTVFCVRCGHGFHAAHARLWFEGAGGGDHGHGRDGHRVCPVPNCDCRCNG